MDLNYGTSEATRAKCRWFKSLPARFCCNQPRTADEPDSGPRIASTARLTQVFEPVWRYHMGMDEVLCDMEEITLEFDEETLEAIDSKAFRDHRENREAAIRTLLDDYLKERSD